MADLPLPPPRLPGTVSYGYCCWHGAPAEEVLLISIIDQGSGPSSPALYACPPCREQHRLVQLADRQLPQASPVSRLEPIREG
jgi:hypothetical protein